MTTLESILVPALLFACVLFGVACAWGYEMRAERDEARVDRDAALRTPPLPEGAVCSEVKHYQKHWFDGAAACQRCGVESPYVKTPESFPNADFEDWNNGTATAPDGWTLAGSGEASLSKPGRA